MISYIEYGQNLNDTLNLRQEMSDLLYGSNDVPVFGQTVVWQKLLRDQNDEPVKSGIRYKGSDEGRDKVRGDYTTRTGFLCELRKAKVFISPVRLQTSDEVTTQTGGLTGDKVLIFSDYRTDLKKHDILIIPEIDSSGNIVNPVNILKEYIITIPISRHADSGRIEYYASVAEVQK